MINMCFLCACFSKRKLAVEVLVDAEAKANQMQWMGHAALLCDEVIPGLSFGSTVYNLHTHKGFKL